MRKNAFSFREPFAVFLIFLLLFGNPPAVAGSGGTVSVDLPIDEIEGLLQELEDAGRGVVGEAGIQIRRSIQEIDHMIRDRLDQLTSNAKEVIGYTMEEIRQQLREIMDFLQEFLEEVNKMAEERIEQLDQALAQRLAQLKDSIIEVLDKLDETIRKAIDNARRRAITVIEMGGQQVLRVVSTLTKTIVRVVLIIIDIIFLVLLGLALLKPRTGKIGKVQIVLSSLVILIVLGASLTLLLSDKAMARVFGSEARIPNPGMYCRVGTELYHQFFDLYQQHASRTRLEQVGLSAIDTLSWCAYASLSEVVARQAEEKIEEINAVLYPPPPSANTPGIGGFVHMDWFSRYNLKKYTVYYQMVKQNKIQVPHPLISPKQYRTVIIHRFHSVTLPEKLIQPIRPLPH